MPFNPAQPYNDLPDLPPARDIESKSVLKACSEARVALARLNSEAGRLPNPTVLINSSALIEARDSSEIENIVTTQDALFRHASLGNFDANPATKDALRYRTALFQAYEGLTTRPISTVTAIRICQTITGIEFDVRKIPGTTLRNRQTDEIIYTPPVGEELIRRKLANWEQFLHTDADLDPVIRMAIQHYQFEAIHPFIDGNGRTGRTINVLFLVEKGILDLPILYLSREILATRQDYYKRLGDVTRTGAWEPWLDYMLGITTLSALNTTKKIANLNYLMRCTELHVRSHAPKLFSRELCDLLFQQPYCRIADLVQAGIAKRQTAAQYLRQLHELGILDEYKVGREKLFLHTKFARLLANREGEITHYTQLGSDATDPSLELMFPANPHSRSI